MTFSLEDYVEACLDFKPEVLGEDSGRPSMNPALADFWRNPSSIKVLYGGRNSSKSWDAAANAVRIALMGRARIVCVRQFQNKISESVYTAIEEQINRFGWRDYFDFQKASIICKKTKAEFLFYGIARNISEIKGLESIDVLWLEEAEAVTEADYRILEATVRKEDSEIWVIFNPRLETDFAWQYFVEDPPIDTVVRKINYLENRFMSDSAFKRMISLKYRDEDDYRHTYLGEPLSDDDLVIIKRRWAEACVGANERLGVAPDGMRRLGFDVADDGDDLNAAIGFSGNQCDFAEEWKGLEDALLQSCGRVYNYARERQAHIYYDSIGVGASAGSKFKELNEKYGLDIGYTKFNAGSRVYRPEAIWRPGIRNKDQFANLKAQAWAHTADRMRETYDMVTGKRAVDPDTVVSISPDLSEHIRRKLIRELCTPHRTFDNSGRTKVETKKELRDRGVKSPNMADAFVMAVNSWDIKRKFNWYVSRLAA